MSSGDSTSITTSDRTSSTTLPVSDRQEAEQRLDEREVGAGARHELAGRELVVAGEVEALEALEDRGAQVVLHVEREAPADEPADVREHEVHRAEADEQHEQRPERLRSASSMTLSTTASLDERDERR